MKTILILAFALICGCAVAQTNLVVFPELRSSTGDLLMTNATYRCAVGVKLFFENDEGEHGFKATDLDTNVLNRLGMSASARAAAQKRIDAQNQAALLAHEAFLQQQALAAQQAEQQAASNAAAMTQSQPQGTGTGTGTKHKSKKNQYSGLLPQ
jgi:hypothetical protein